LGSLESSSSLFDDVGIRQMSEELEAAQAVERFLKMVEGLSLAAPVLRKMASIKQVAEEAEKRTAATKQEHDRLLNDLKTLRSETSRLREESEAGMSMAKREADEYFDETQKRAERLYNNAKEAALQREEEAKARIEKMDIDALEKRRKQLDVVQEQISRKETALALISRELASAEKAYKQVKEQLDQLRKQLLPAE
jgi:hypothetical protein